MSSHRDHPVFRRGRGQAAIQPSLLPDPLEERLRDEPMVLGLRQLVESVLGDSLRREFSRSGGYAYDPVGLFCVWMYGLLHGVRSSRRLEEACRYDIRYEYLCRSCRPDHTTLSRFRQSLGDTLDEHFASIARAAREENPVSGRTAMVDGTKIPAARSQWRKYLKEAADPEPEAVTMLSYGKYFHGYNVQIAVDLDSGMVLGYCATSSPNDLCAMEPLMQAVETQSGQLPEAVVTDRGYSSVSNAHALDSRGVAAYLPPSHSVTPFSPAPNGTFVCPAGRTATESYEHNKAYNLHYRTIRMSRCASCPIGKQCGSGHGSQRRLKIPVGAPVGDLRAANLRAHDPENQNLMRARAPSVERVFAILKWCLGLRRFSLRNRTGARLEFGLQALAYNIRRLLSLIWALFGRIFAKLSPGLAPKRQNLPA